MEQWCTGLLGQAWRWFHSSQGFVQGAFLGHRVRIDFADPACFCVFQKSCLETDELAHLSMLNIGGPRSAC